VQDINRRLPELTLPDFCVMFEEGEQGDDGGGDTVQDEGVVDDTDKPRERL
jgi:hypothetical protein